MVRIETIVEKVEKDNPDIKTIYKAADIIKKGGVVAFPTETVYGLGANSFDDKAIDKIFIAKGRPQDNPLILHVNNVEEVYLLVETVDKKAKKVMESFWPGPLTLIFKKSEKVSKKLTGGLSTVAIRMPKHKIASEIIKYSKVPIAAPSANLSGKPSPTNAEHVIRDLYGRVDMIIDGGDTGIGVESTVLDISQDIPTILRPGGVTYEDLIKIFPKVEYDQSIIKDDEDIVPKSPGQKYKHYAPKAKMIVFSGNIEDIPSAIKKYSKKAEEEGKKLGIMATEETKKEYSGENILVVGSRKEKDTIAKNLFKVLRQFDDLNVDIILAEGVDTTGIGTAIMNRMKKACGGNIIKV
ncbi:L-threonylcarbamoyladenylate synthase [Anaerosalibacter massiliensis]|uniref:Threonylcarbamoyl-AMP synthase n=1 Tax=Anaerosalibacter massiliensis TaxID=1347392 RepID=A0A9X2S5L4_9FIRM|nr:L-threonylcarbamoyladenylate synthase [Anaerosalibacter massiliensis]MCR2044683.1 L-threonylcarbamoyladenylate synthase [Anaerosalibacter massiliensis]